jgi:hypothetical protein
VEEIIPEGDRMSELEEADLMAESEHEIEQELHGEEKLGTSMEEELSESLEEGGDMSAEPTSRENE